MSLHGMDVASFCLCVDYAWDDEWKLKIIVEKCSCWAYSKEEEKVG